MNSCFSQTLAQWYAQYGRDLPWRHTTNPYLIWISETILQQTRVCQGMVYYARFVARFPSVESLAAASMDEVLLLWQGLGYYSRARHLHEAAQEIAQRGEFPINYADVRALPGVGEYTAAAVCSFAYGAPYAVLDGNVFRVLARYFGIDAPIDTSAGRKAFRALADEMLDAHDSARYNQSLMDFGAMVCTPRSPQCAVCPLASSCAALRNDTVALLPRRQRKTAVRHRYFTYLCLVHPTRGIYLQQRGKGDIWQGLYEPYCHESAQPLELAEALQLLPQCTIIYSTCGVSHQLTHQLIHADCHLVHTTLPADALPGIWVAREQLSDFAMPALVLRLLEQVFQHEA